MNVQKVPRCAEPLVRTKITKHAREQEICKWIGIIKVWGVDYLLNTRKKENSRISPYNTDEAKKKRFVWKLWVWWNKHTRYSRWRKFVHSYIITKSRFIISNQLFLVPASNLFIFFYWFFIWLCVKFTFYIFFCFYYFFFFIFESKIIE